MTHRILFPPLSAIEVPPDRQRQSFPEDAQQELINDISERGLLNPIIVRGKDNFTLVTGERRLRAITFLSEVGIPFHFQGQPVAEGTIPTLHLNDCTDLEAREAELSENLIRKDLTWQEVTRARAELHRLRSEQAAAEGREWTTQDTVAELSSSDSLKGNLNDVSMDLRLEQHLDDPEVAKAKSQRDAVKAVRKKLEREERQKKAEQFHENPTPHTLIKGDMFSELPKLPDASFDILLTDPPYGQGMHENKAWGVSIHEYDDSEKYFQKISRFLAPEAQRLLAPEAHAYIFCNLPGFQQLALDFSAAGFDVWPRPLIWYKGNIGSYPLPFHGPRLTYECILYARRGDKRVTQLFHDVIVDHPNIQNQAHPAGKPVGLYENLLRRSAVPGDRVLDPFCGKGTIFPAADKHSCIATGIELSDEYYPLAVETLYDN